MTFEEFYNTVEIMKSFNRDELTRSRVIENHSSLEWEEYAESPAHFFTAKGKEGRAERLFKAMQLRLPSKTEKSKR